MSLINNSTVYHINSRNRVNGTDSDFTYRIEIPPDSKYNKVAVLQISIPKSYYLVQDGEHFTLQEGKDEIKILMTSGNYTRKSFAASAQQLLNSNSPNGWVYEIKYQNSSLEYDDGKYTYNVTGNISQPSLIFDGDHNICEQFGFDNNSTNTFVSNTLKSVNVINMQRESTLYLHSDISNNTNDNILQEIFSSSSNDFSSIVFQQTEAEAYSKDITSNTSNIYSFYLTNENNKPINLNGLNLVFSLVLYEKNPIYNMIREFIKLQIIQK